MNVDCKLFKKTFNTKDTGEEREYYVLVFDLVGGETLEVPLKSDKAKILLMSNSLKSK